MGDEFQHRIEALRSDYQDVTGSPFAHFFCPILFRDEDVELCHAHILNAAFPNSARNWTVQRADVDNFYGSAFESEFVNLRYQGQPLADRALGDPTLSKNLRPKIRIDGQEVEHFVASGPVPPHFTEALVGGPRGPVRLALKIRPEEAPDTSRWQIEIERDIRLPSLASMLKSAYLTMFDMLGYRYALSAGGHFLGWSVLGEFFTKNRGRRKVDILANGQSHFREFANMMRPVVNPPVDLVGTAADRTVFVCRCHDDAPWGMVVFIKTSHLVHAVIVPILESESAAARFMSFLRGEGCRIRANRCRFDGTSWYGAKDHEFLEWPTAAFEEPLLQKS